MPINGKGVTIQLVKQDGAKAMAIFLHGYVLATAPVILQGAANDLGDNYEARDAHLKG